jgi:hypothetical protein
MGDDQSGHAGSADGVVGRFFPPHIRTAGRFIQELAAQAIRRRSMNMTPPVTMRSPGLSPSTISTSSPLRMPSRTCRSPIRSLPRTSQTAASSPRPSYALAGTPIVGFVSASAMRRLACIPGFNAPSADCNSAHTSKRRVRESNALAMRVIRATK